jgi:hypothetical protein
MFNVEDKQRKRAERQGFSTVCINLSQHRNATGSGIEDALTRFNTDPACNVCLLTSGSSAAGLTLTAAKVCYILEPTHNAAEEAQALNRVHRIGQLQSVRCVIFYAKKTCEERILALRHEQNTLTTMLSNLNNVVEAVEEEEEVDEIVTGARRRAQSRKRNRRQVSTLSGDAFFSAGQLHLLFGATEERAERKMSTANQEAVAAANTNRHRNLPAPRLTPPNRNEREAQGIARAPQPNQRYTYLDLLHMALNSSDDEDWEDEGEEDEEEEEEEEERREEDSYSPRQRARSRGPSAEDEVIEISD